MILWNYPPRCVFSGAALQKRVQPVEPPDSHHLRAALGWLELGNAVEAEAELDKIAPALQKHPAVLAVRFEIHSKTANWDAAVQIAGTQVNLTPEDPGAWISLAYATRRKSGGGIPQARDILARAHSKFPDQGLIPYNLACYDCQLGRLNEAWQWLQKAFALGDLKQIKKMALADPDLQSLWKKIGEL